MNKYYLDDEQIKTLIKRCEEYYIPTKEKLKKLSKKYNLNLGSNRKNNIDQFALMVKNKMLKENLQYIQGSFEDIVKNNEPFLFRYYIHPYINEKYSDDFNIIEQIDPDKFFTENIKTIINPIDYNYLRDEYDNANLFEIDNFKEYWEKYSIKNINKSLLYASQQISTTIENLIVELMRKYGDDKIKFFNIHQALKEFLKSHDTHKLHNFLIDVDFFDLDKNENLRIQKENQIKEIETTKEIYKSNIAKEKQKLIDLVNMKLNEVITTENYEGTKKQIEKAITEYQQKLKEIE